MLLNGDGEFTTLLQVVGEKNVEQGRLPVTRVDLRFGAGPGGLVFLLSKHDGTIRLLVLDTSMSR